jgi:hypothetical protein
LDWLEDDTGYSPTDMMWRYSVAEVGTGPSSERAMVSNSYFQAGTTGMEHEIAGYPAAAAAEAGDVGTSSKPLDPVAVDT